MVIFTLWEVSLLKRTHTCGELNKKNLGEVVILNGWVERIRDLGGIKFLLLRDRYGFTQVVIDPDKNKDLYKKANKIGNEYTLEVSGTVRARPDEAINNNMTTGEIEILAEDFIILSESENPPIYINTEEDEASEDLRLKYRYLDLRRKKIQKNIILRHEVAQVMREYLNNLNFIEVETPILGKTTPEGARDFLVPSRTRKGNFYALPQSPQLYKQLLMVAGFDRYYQIVKCFRDEDFRADRQPEFTQLDLEMSFVDQEDIFKLIEGLFKNIFEKVLSSEINTPFERMTYNDAITNYGSDKPDLRYGMKFEDLTDYFNFSTISFIKSALEEKEKITGFIVKNLSENYSRKKIDEFTEFFKSLGMSGLLWIKGGNNIKSSILKVCPEEVKKIVKDFSISENDILFMGIGKGYGYYKKLGRLRDKVIKDNCLTAEGYDIHWITDFPMFSYDEEEKRYKAEHHAFTMPDLADLENCFPDEIDKIKSTSYDLVLNGFELASGSVRIHRRDIQNKIFKIIGINDEEANEKFGYLLEAFKYGPPPHAGIAIGVDRLIAIFANANSIRDVIAFPKVASGADLMTGAPNEPSDDQLNELGIKK
ncbi:MAG: aspartyl-tRNA synthetase [Kosmotogales bacterium]|nr:aspartyl-tRNA synthetase [Kosmotogales bacterium]